MTAAVHKNLMVLAHGLLAATMFCSSPSQAQQDEVSGWPDINAGRAAYNIECRSCHSLKVGQADRGPSLLGIYGRVAGGDPAFVYSEQLRESKVVWTEETLNTYLRNPFEMGTQVNMIIHGIRDPKERADLIAFLKHEAR